MLIGFLTVMYDLKTTSVPLAAMSSIHVVPHSLIYLKTFLEHLQSCKL